MSSDKPDSSSMFHDTPSSGDLNFFRARERALLALVSEGVISSDTTGIIQTLNPAAERMFGYGSDELVGKNLSVLMPSPFAEQHDDFMRHYLDTGERKIIGIGREVFGRRKDGSVFPLHLAVSELVVGGRHVFVGVLRDLSEQVEARRLAADKESLEGSLSAKLQHEQSLQAALREKEILLKEVHHRVKNNLQLILSLINLRLRRSRGLSAEVVVEEVRSRIHSIALLHEMLYRGADLVHIDFGDYLKILTQQLLRDFGAGADISLNVRADPVPLDLDHAIPCGLIVSELVTNCLKYAFSAHGRGSIEVSLLRSPDNTIHLQVADNGKGFSSEINPQQSTSLGLELVRKLSEKLQGTVEFHSQGGTRVEVKFPLRDRA